MSNEAKMVRLVIHGDPEERRQGPKEKVGGI